MKRDPEVLFEDNHLLVVNKPAVLATMGAEAGEPSLLAQCKEYLKRKYSKPGNVFLGVVSRLDSFVTGAIVFARTSKAASRLTRQFQERTVQKRYLAMVAGEPRRTEGELESWLKKDDRRRRMVSVDSGDRNAKQAKLRYKVVERVKRRSIVYTLLEIELLTGRKHQIRVQLSETGMPIVGDRKYGSDEPFPIGIALHAKLLSFDHPTSKTRITIKSNPPKYWNLPKIDV